MFFFIKLSIAIYKALIIFSIINILHIDGKNRLELGRQGLPCRFLVKCMKYASASTHTECVYCSNSINTLVKLAKGLPFLA